MYGLGEQSSADRVTSLTDKVVRRGARDPPETALTPKALTTHITYVFSIDICWLISFAVVKMKYVKYHEQFKAAIINKLIHCTMSSFECDITPITEAFSYLTTGPILEAKT